MIEKNTLIKRCMQTIIGLVIIAAAITVYYQKFYSHATLPKPVSIDTTNQPTLGNPEAKIHFVAFEDLKCANCARFSNTLFPDIKKSYIDTGKAKYTLINLAFIDGSLPAANAARCIYDQNAALFFSFVEYVYAHQPPENENWANIPKLLDFANHIPGVNIDTLTTCLVNNPYDQFFKDNMKQAEKLMPNAVATPTLYINGVIVRPLTQERINEIVKAME